MEPNAILATTLLTLALAGMVAFREFAAGRSIAMVHGKLDEGTRSLLDELSRRLSGRPSVPPPPGSGGGGPIPDSVPPPPPATKAFAYGVLAEIAVGSVACALLFIIHPKDPPLSLIASVLTLTIAAVAATKSAENGAAIQQVHVSLNSRLTALLTASTQAARAEGVVAGKDTLLIDQVKAAEAAEVLRVAAEDAARVLAVSTKAAQEALAQAAVKAGAPGA